MYNYTMSASFFFFFENANINITYEKTKPYRDGINNTINVCSAKLFSMRNMYVNEM